MAAVHPQNYAVTTVEEQHNQANTHRHRDSFCTPKKRCVTSIIITILIAAAIICAIAIPLALDKNDKKDTDPQQNSTIITTTTTTTTSSSSSSSVTPEDRNESTMNTHHTSMMTAITRTTALIKTTRSSTENRDSNVTSNDGIPTTTVNHNGTHPNDLTGTWVNDMKITTLSNPDETDRPFANISKESTITPTTITTTTPRSLIQLNHFDDKISGVFNTKVGGRIGGFHTDRKNQTAEFAMDGSLKTKYFNTKMSDANEKGIDTGFIVIPLKRRPTVACAIQFGTGSDRPDRDPITVTLEGSNDTDIIQLNSSSTWEAIYDGETGLKDFNISLRSEYAPQQEFKNQQVFISYRLLITSIRNNTDGVQYSEARILGCP